MNFELIESESNKVNFIYFESNLIQVKANNELHFKKNSCKFCFPNKFNFLENFKFKFRQNEISNDFEFFRIMVKYK